jgi:hypothetical protein
LRDGPEKSIRNTTRICHSTFLGAKALLLSIRFRDYSSKRCKKASTAKENIASIASLDCEVVISASGPDQATI